ncbi:hypothetical protein K3495_g2473 [Podosphaera aphanis]|nr:hypothetical protein K3495_g2473 [Podosphaera aphanis]
MNNQQRNALIAAIEDKISNNNYLIWILRAKGGNYDPTPLTYALNTNADKGDLMHLQNALINLLNDIGLELDHMTKEGNRLKDVEESLTKKLDMSSKRV